MIHEIIILNIFEIPNNTKFINLFNKNINERNE